MDYKTYIPKPNENYIEPEIWQLFSNVVSSDEYLPIYLTGMSGIGKSEMVEQFCARNNRKFIRLNFTAETQESELIGQISLVNGSTVYQKGPVVQAMEEGAVLLLDEFDKGSVNIMCLQSVLESPPKLFVKNLNEWIDVHPDFRIVMTGNTKGSGDPSGGYISCNIFDKALTDRFLMVDFPPPTQEEEYDIVIKAYPKLEELVLKLLTKLSSETRRMWQENQTASYISTRKLLFIAKMLNGRVSDDLMTILNIVFNSYDEESKVAFLEYWKTLNAPEKTKLKEEEIELDVDWKSLPWLKNS